MGFEIQKKFDYAEVSADLGASLRKHETTIRGIQSKAIYDIGEELAAARDEMSGTAGNHVGGRFYAWCESIGLKVKTVQNILAYHDFVRQNLPNQAMLEELPKSLVYEVARKSAPPELKQGVLNGDITTLKEYKALKAELEAEQKARAEAENQRAAFEQKAMETEQRAQTQVADMKFHLKSAEAELSSIKVEMLHKQAEVDALKHEQKMQTEPQVVEIPDTASREEIARLRDQLAQSRKTVERQEFCRCNQGSERGRVWVV